MLTSFSKTMSTITAMTSPQALLCSSSSFSFHATKPILRSNPSFCHSQKQVHKQRFVLAAMDAKTSWSTNSIIATKRDFKLKKLSCRAVPQKPTSSNNELDGNVRKVLQFSLWIAEGVYILWLFLLPYAPVRTSASMFLFLPLFLYLKFNLNLFASNNACFFIWVFLLVILRQHFQSFFIFSIFSLIYIVKYGISIVI